MKKWFLLIVLFVLWMFPDKVIAEEVHLYLFYGNTCPVCEKERNYLKELLPNYPEVQLFEFETYDNLENEVNMQTVKAMYHIRGEGVPFLVVGDIAIYGFGDGTPARIESAIKKQEIRDYYDRVGVYLGIFSDEEIEEVPSEDDDVEVSGLVSANSDYKEDMQGNSFWKWTSLGVIIAILGMGIVVYRIFGSRTWTKRK